MTLHPYTEFEIAALRHRERLAAAARYRAAREHAAHGGNRRGVDAPRPRVGAALVRLDRRLRGARPLAPVGSRAEPMAASDARP